MGVAEVRAEPCTEGWDRFGAGVMWEAAVMDGSIQAFHIGMGKAGIAPAFSRFFSPYMP